MAKRWYYKDENGNKVPVPQYKINADDYYTKAMSDSRYYEKSATDTLLADKVSKSDIVQNTGQSTTSVMSQKAVSDELSEIDGKLFDKVETINHWNPSVGALRSSGVVQTSYTWCTYSKVKVKPGDVLKAYQWITDGGITGYHDAPSNGIFSWCAYNNGTIVASASKEEKVITYIVPDGVDEVGLTITTNQIPNILFGKNIETLPTEKEDYHEPVEVLKTDKTLTKENEAADAASTGNALGELDTRVSAIENVKGEKFVSAGDILSYITAKDCEGVEVIDNKGLTYVSTTDKTFKLVDIEDSYVLKFDLSKFVSGDIFSGIVSQNSSGSNLFAVSAIDDEHYNWAGNGCTTSKTQIGYTYNDGGVSTLDISRVRSTYATSNYLFLSISKSNDIEWKLEGGNPKKSFSWLKLGDAAKAELKNEIKKDNIKVVLPSTVYAAVGHEMNIYFESCILCDDINRYSVFVSFNALTTSSRGYKECARVTPIAKQSTPCKMYIYDKVTNQKILEYDFNVKVSEDIKYSKKIVFIGDSLTDRAIFPAEICQELGNGQLLSLGTKHDNFSYISSGDKVVNVNIDNEGRGGWSATDYCTKANGNAFWNPNASTFDFSYYMQQQEYSGVDCVVIALGTNDVGKPMMNADFDEIISSFSTMVNSIHSYNANIKVIVVPPHHGAEPDGWSTSTHSNQTATYNFLQFKLVELLIKEFENKPNIYIAPAYLNIDHHNDFPTSEVAISARNPKLVKRQNNNVHFSVDNTNPVSQCWGYLKMADAIWYTMLAAFSEVN